jgi:hypothetical protein
VLASAFAFHVLLNLFPFSTARFFPNHSSNMAMTDALTSFSRRRQYIFAFAIFFTLLILFYGTRQQRLAAIPATPQQYPTVTIDFHQDQEQSSSFDGNWNYTRDYRNLFLTQRQCDAAFPGLFEEVERPVKLRKSNKITLKELDDTPALNGFIRAMIYDQQVCSEVPRSCGGKANNDTKALHNRNIRTNLLARFSHTTCLASRNAHIA